MAQEWQGWSPGAQPWSPAPTQPVPWSTYRGPARTAHGLGYWLVIGWWWQPVTFLGRVLLWLLVWPVGLWRSLRHGRKNRERRERRGYR